MKSATLIRRSLFHYWRTNSAVLLGVMAATAVIGGALIVGDSVRDSLRQMSLDRLGGVDAALVAPRFFRQQLAEEVDARQSRARQEAVGGDDERVESITAKKGPLPDGRGSVVAPAIVLQAAVTHEADGATRRAAGVALYGAEQSLWDIWGEGDHTGGTQPPGENEVVLNRRVADALNVAAGDEVSLLIEIPAAIPRDALLGDRNETVTELPLTVVGIAEDASTPGRFGLNPAQQLPLNVFVNLETLQGQLGMQHAPVSRRNPTEKPARINAIFVDDDSAGAEELTAQIDESLTLSDLSLRLISHEEQGYLSLESEQMILEETVGDAALQVADELQLTASPVLVYLLNEIASPADPDRFSMYSVVAGIDFDEPAPFGPLEFVAGGPPTQPGEVVINEWLAEDLGITDVGTTINVTHKVVGDRGELPDVQRTWTVAGILKLTGPAADPHYTPFVEGITDADSFGDWRQPFPMDLDRVTPRDETYWDEHKTTPKVLLRLEDAQELFTSRYGNLTSVRFAPQNERAPTDVAETFTQHLLAVLTGREPRTVAEEQELVPKLSRTTGLEFQPVREQGLAAASGTTDFTGLFIGFSFFLIAAALLLIGLLVRLGLERRVSQCGLLAAVGLTPQQVRRVFLAEIAAIVLVGGLLGCLAAVAYAALMIHGLKTWWFGAIGTQFLHLSVHPLTLLTGFLITVVMSILTSWYTLWRMRNVSTRQMLSGVSEAPLQESAQQARGRRSRATAIVSGSIALVLLIATLAGLVPASEAFGGFNWRVVSFFVVGVASLVGSLSLLAWWLDRGETSDPEGLNVPLHRPGSEESQTATGTACTAEAVPIEEPHIHSAGQAVARPERNSVSRSVSGVISLGLRNAARHRGRSVLTASLIAAATFVIVAVAAGRRNPAVEAPVNDSGNGGFTLLAESSTPILYDLNTEQGRVDAGMDVADDAAKRVVDAMRVMPFRVRPGEDASCLNLYQTRLPRILGVPSDVLQTMIDEQRFRFADTPGDEPWALLNEPLEGGRIPVLGDMNTLMYSLHKGIGDAIDVPSDVAPATLEVVGMFDGSIFQGMLLMSEENFHRLFPDRAGFGYFLIEVDPSEAGELSSLLETQLADYGFDVTPVADRLADFLAVQNTYLSTFQTLGGLGLLLGTLGLGTVMLRNVLERRGELALLRAVGFRNAHVTKMVLAENAFLLLWGLLAGTLSALLAMGPHLLSTGADVPWTGLQLMLLAVFAIGMTAALLAVREAVRTPILATLRADA